MEVGMENGASYKEEKGLGWGKSLPVQSVQELVRRDPSSVPERYIRDHAKGPKDREVSAITPDIPVIDFSLLTSGHEDERQRLDLACKEWGFFQTSPARNGASSRYPEKTLYLHKSWSCRRYSEKKRKYAMAPNDVQEYGQAFVVPNGQKLDWNDLLSMMVPPAEERRINEVLAANSSRFQVNPPICCSRCNKNHI